MARAWVLTARPQGMPRHENFGLVEVSDRPLEAGEIRVANRWLSVDPYMRGRMNDVKSYAAPFALGEPMTGHALGEVIESRCDDRPVGARVLHWLGWRDQSIVAGSDAQLLPDIAVDEQAFLGQFGMPGMTAYFGLLTVAEAKAGETVFVSAAAGAVGSTVVQIAKARGMTVIGAAGGPEKCDWVRALGADHAIDYKDGVPLAKALKQAAPDGIDVYFDNVGGDHLDAALAQARLHARFAICGMIDIYNDSKPTALRYLARMIAARIRMQGFLVGDHMDRVGEFYATMARWQAEGQLRREETVMDGLETAPDAFLALFTGGNTGKMLVRL